MSEWLLISRVKLSVKSDYAARAVLALARNSQGDVPQRVEALAEAHGIPPNYLVQILIELKSRNIVKSVRGKEGGYLLAKPPSEITLGEIIRCTNGQVFDTPAMTDPQCPAELRLAWCELQKQLEEASDRINFQVLLERANGRSTMYDI